MMIRLSQVSSVGGAVRVNVTLITFSAGALYD